MAHPSQPTRSQNGTSETVASETVASETVASETVASETVALSRRNFLKTGLQTGIGVATFAHAPDLMRTANAQTLATPEIMGAGSHRYRVVPNWGVLPTGKVWGITHGVQTDRQNRVFVHNQSADAVMIFDGAGNFLKSWGKEFEGGAHGIQLRREGDNEFLYLADYARHIVVKTTLDGEEVWRISVPKAGNLYANEGEYKPTNVAFAPNGDFYVADGYGKGFVHHYNLKAEHIRSWGTRGNAPGQLNCPHGLWVDTRGQTPMVVIADRENRRLQNFSLDGEFVNVSATDLRRPCHVDARGRHLLVPELAGRVSILDWNNQVLATLGDNPNTSQHAQLNVPVAQRDPNRFCSPHGACWDNEGNIYVVEYLKPGRVTKLARVA